jgi:integrase/recombinase XerD
LIPIRPDAHNYQRRIDCFFEKLKNNRAIHEEDKKLLEKYRDYLASEGITLGRNGKYLSDLRKASELLGKRYQEANEQDIRRIVSIYESNERYSPWSKRDFKVALRKFYTWLRRTKEYPPEVAWIKVYTRIRNARAAEDMLTEEEVKRLIDFAGKGQWKTFIATLYESGCRIGELICLKINQVKFDDLGAQLFVTGKTGFQRVRVVACVPYLLEWMNEHPLKNEPEAYLWLSDRMGPLTYNGITRMLRLVSKKAGIIKKMNPHNFRHSRATYLANHLTEAQMKEHFGWVQDSDMASIYVHLSGHDVDNALLKVYGMQNDEVKQESILKAKECARCRQVNQVMHILAHSGQ